MDCTLHKEMKSQRPKRENYIRYMIHSVRRSSLLLNNHNLDLLVGNGDGFLLSQSNRALRSSSVSSREMERQRKEQEELGGDHGKDEASVGSGSMRVGHHLGGNLYGEEVGRGERGVRRRRRRSVVAGTVADKEGFDGSHGVVHVSSQSAEEGRRSVLVLAVLAMSVVVVRSVVGSVVGRVRRRRTVVGRRIVSRVTGRRGRTAVLGTVFIVGDVLERDLLDSERFLCDFVDVHPGGEFVLCSEHLLGGVLKVKLLDGEHSERVIDRSRRLDFVNKLRKVEIGSLAGSQHR